MCSAQAERKSFDHPSGATRVAGEGAGGGARSRGADLCFASRSLYYEPQPVPGADLAIMRRVDALHLDYPFAGSRMLRDLLRSEGFIIGREKVRTMMRRMCIEALYRRPNTSKPCPGHKIYPYLLRGLAVERAHQVWAMDITYIPMARGFVYLAAVVESFSRRVLAWRISITMEINFCLDAVEKALARHGKPAIFNTDQGSQFTSDAFTAMLWKRNLNQHRWAMAGFSADEEIAFFTPLRDAL